ncbi:MAG: hypothetical protein QOG52_263 [Frankiaceae bacterium]|jgi:hypothetical protein|nr:hypothetical protein [Frankiaceae bacterium]
MSDGRQAVGLGWPGEVPATAAGLGWPGDASPRITGDRATAFAVPGHEVPAEGVSTEVDATANGRGSGQNGGLAT